MNFRRIMFKAVEAPQIGECTGCMLDAPEHDLEQCHEASDLAGRRGLPDCEHVGPNGRHHIYVREDDPAYVKSALARAA
jgi:hypothetical protein